MNIDSIDKLKIAAKKADDTLKTQPMAQNKREIMTPLERDGRNIRVPISSTTRNGNFGVESIDPRELSDIFEQDSWRFPISFIHD